MNENTSPRTILVPVDFSETSKRGLHQAGLLAQKLDCRLELLRVLEFNPVHYAPLAAGSWYTRESIDKVHQELREMAERFLPEGLVAETNVVIGPDASRTIVERAGEIGAELIVMGTHSRSGLAHFFLGSTAEAVVRHAPCPVMTVGPERESAQQAA